VSSFLGPQGRPRLLALYQQAIAQGYRFYSFGDGMLLWGGRNLC
ncbi:MAG TPA: tRNA preQ1(34) S-adenosylmethionine ribosyltransferase-isomerase QueA, partial [Cyanobacteria bacterium UBA8156]|nr:tRNA preQ1(34) S-adenosylmethionine ribosyltransferase-isomerase QueA [Cyanobacteria bacterium UBA8156]